MGTSWGASVRDYGGHARGSHTRPHKYRAKAVRVCLPCGIDILDGQVQCAHCGGLEIIRFDSKAERRRWGELLLLVAAGQIENLQRQVNFRIEVPTPEGCFEKIGVYRADFTYERDNDFVVEDVKGVMTALSRFKIKCVEAQHGVNIVLIRR